MSSSGKAASKTPPLATSHGPPRRSKFKTQLCVVCTEPFQCSRMYKGK